MFTILCVGEKELPLAWYTSKDKQKPRISMEDYGFGFHLHISVKSKKTKPFPVILKLLSASENEIVFLW